MKYYTERVAMYLCIIAGGVVGVIIIYGLTGGI